MQSIQTVIDEIVSILSQYKELTTREIIHHLQPRNRGSNVKISFIMTDSGKFRKRKGTKRVENRTYYSDDTYSTNIMYIGSTFWSLKEENK
jgi:hypothetical protein